MKDRKKMKPITVKIKSWSMRFRKGHDPVEQFSQRTRNFCRLLAMPYSHTPPEALIRLHCRINHIN